MVKKKNTLKAKEPIRIRFKELANGNKSIYLDVYQNGGRSYEFLKLYLIPETDAASRRQNQNTMLAAEAIKAQRLLALINGKTVIKAVESKMMLSEWIAICAKKKACRTALTYISTRNVILAYGDVMLKDIDKKYCLGYIEYLKNGFTSKYKNKPLSQGSGKKYMVALICVLNNAVREGLMQGNPFDKIAPSDKITYKASKRCFLEVEEVAKLIATPYDKLPEVKQSFLFQCFCGLRISDVIGLTWGNVVLDSQRPHLELTIQKTKQQLDVDLSQEALKWLPERGEASDNDKVFDTLSPSHINVNLRRWAKVAGIKKHITTHVARHTFATMSLTAGVDLYTTSKMLGHTKITTTQIYAEIINKKKQDAVAKISDMFADK